MNKQTRCTADVHRPLYWMLTCLYVRLQYSTVHIFTYCSFKIQTKHRNKQYKGVRSQWMTLEGRSRIRKIPTLFQTHQKFSASPSMYIAVSGLINDPLSIHIILSKLLKYCRRQVLIGNHSTMTPKISARDISNSRPIASNFNLLNRRSLERELIARAINKPHSVLSFKGLKSRWFLWPSSCPVLTSSRIWTRRMLRVTETGAVKFHGSGSDQSQ